jgi:hypothetical protein
MWVIFGIHFAELCITICTEYFKIQAMNAVSMAAGMILNLLWIIVLTRLWYTIPYNFFQDYWHLDNKSITLPDGKVAKLNVALAINTWIFVEMINCCGLVFTNIWFLMIRSCARHKLTFDKGASNELADSETIDALKPLINSFNSTWVPFLVCVLFHAHTHTFVMKNVYFSTTINAIISLVLIFVHWQKGPPMYKKYAPYFFFGGVIFTWVLSPIYIVSLLIWQLTRIEQYHYYTSVYLMYFVFVYAFRLGEFFSRIRPVVLEMRETVKINSELERMSNDELRAELKQTIGRDEDDPSPQNKLKIKLINIQLEQKVPYMEQPRPMGGGERRIGHVVALENDIFGFAYCILLKDRYILENLDIFRGQYWEEEDFPERD